MLSIRPATKKDRDTIKKILEDADLFYSALTMEAFWVAEMGNKIVGTVQLKDYEDFFFLGSLVVVAEEQGKGVASALLKEVLRSHQKNIYLYTIVPEFFEKFGFKITSPLPDLPSKDHYECEDCHSKKCVCMVKYPDAP